MIHLAPGRWRLGKHIAFTDALASALLAFMISSANPLSAGGGNAPAFPPATAQIAGQPVPKFWALPASVAKCLRFVAISIGGCAGRSRCTSSALGSRRGDSSRAAADEAPTGQPFRKV